MAAASPDWDVVEISDFASSYYIATRVVKPLLARAAPVAVDVANQVVGLQQARARYQAGVRNRVLEQQLLDAEQKKFSLGASTSFNVVTQQRDLATAQSTEVAALVAYSNARVGLDETLGVTLETNHVSIKEAMAGRVARTSGIPATVPDQP